MNSYGGLSYAMELKYVWIWIYFDVSTSLTAAGQVDSVLRDSNYHMCQRRPIHSVGLGGSLGICILRSSLSEDNT